MLKEISWMSAYLPRCQIELGKNHIVYFANFIKCGACISAQLRKKPIIAIQSHGLTNIDYVPISYIILTRCEDYFISHFPHPNIINPQLILLTVFVMSRMILILIYLAESLFCHDDICFSALGAHEQVPFSWEIMIVLYSVLGPCLFHPADILPHGIMRLATRTTESYVPRVLHFLPRYCQKSKGVLPKCWWLQTLQLGMP